jgi:protein gp37
MADNSAIEWTDATWNQVTGGTKISPGWDNCYAARFSECFRGVPGHPFETGFDLSMRPQSAGTISHLETAAQPAIVQPSLLPSPLSEGPPQLS